MNFIGKNFLILESVYHQVNGTTATIISNEMNENCDIIFQLDMAHPEDVATNLWVNISEGIVED